MLDSSYGLTRTLDCPFADGVSRIRESLAQQGFGVLTEIDLAGTLKKKMDASLRPYVILGACHPPSALKAVQMEPAIGLLLPCNVVVAEDQAGHAVVSAIDPKAMFSVVDRDGMDELVNDVRTRLEAAIEAA